MFYSLVTGFQTLRLMKDILKQNQLSDMAPRVLLVLVVPAQPPLWPSPPCPWPQTPFQPSLGHPDLTGAMPEECWSPPLPHGWTSNPRCSFVSRTVSVLALFLLQTGPSGWTLTLVHRLLCLGLLMDPDTSLMCSDPVGHHLLVRALRRTPASPPLRSSPSLTTPCHSRVRSWD